MSDSNENATADPFESAGRAEGAKRSEGVTLSDRGVALRLRFLAVGAGLALLGLALDDRRITGTAIVVLGLGVGMRIWLGMKERRRPEADPND